MRDKIMPTDELIAINGEYIPDVSAKTFPQILKKIQKAGRPLTATFVLGERREEAHSEQEEGRAQHAPTLRGFVVFDQMPWILQVPTKLAHHPPQEVDLDVGQLAAGQGLAQENHRLFSGTTLEEVDALEQVAGLLRESGDLLGCRTTASPRALRRSALEAAGGLAPLPAEQQHRLGEVEATHLPAGGDVA